MIVDLGDSKDQPDPLASAHQDPQEGKSGGEHL